MRYISNLSLISLILVSSTILTAGDGDNQNKKRSSSQNYPAKAFVKRVISIEEQSAFRSSKPINLPSPQNTTSISLTTASGVKFNFPTTSVYDYGWNSGIRDFVDVSSNGNVHLTAFVRTLVSVNDRHVVYWYNPGEPDELFVQATPSDGKGWSNIQTLNDGRASIVFHVDDNGFLVDQLEGFAIFVPKAQPIASAVWMHHQIGSNDVIWFATNRWSVWPGDTTRVWSSTDDGNAWTESQPIDMSGTHSRNPPEPVLRVSQDGSRILVKNEWDGISEVGLDSADITAYHWSSNSGAAWNEVIVTFDPYQTSPADPALVADVFMSDVGTSDTLIIENFGQTDITYDYLGNVHMIMSGYSWHWNAAAGETQFAWPQLHYSSARGELAANFVEVSDPAVSHSDMIHAFVDSGYFAGNNIGLGYPTISAAPDAPALVAVWCQPQLSGGVPDTIGRFMVNDLWLSSSPDAGNTWTLPVQITNTPDISEVFPTLAKPLEATGIAGEYRYHLVYLEDHVPGTWVFGESDSGLAQWVYATDVVTATIPQGPQIIVSPTLLNYDTLEVGMTLDLAIRISSIGTDTLEVMSIISNNSDFSVSETSLFLAPALSHDINVTFSPSSIGSITGTLTITSNDSDNTEVLVSLSGVGEAGDLAVSVFSTFGNSGDTVTVPITVMGVAGFNIISAEFTVVSDSILTPVFVNTTGGILTGTDWFVELSISGDTIRFAGAGTDSLSVSGTLVEVLYVIDSTALEGMVGHIRFDSFLFNEGTPAASTIDGHVTVGIPYGDVSLNGEIHAYDAALLLSFLAGKYTFGINEELVSEVSGDGNITSFDASLILQKVVKLIDLFPVEGGAMPVLSPSAGFELPDLSAAPGELLRFPIYIKNVSDVLSIEAVLNYGTDVFDFERFDFSDDFDGWFKATREDDGFIELFLASARGMEGDLLLGEAVFSVNKEADGIGKISLNNVRINEEEVIEEAAVGSVILTVTGVLGESDGIPLMFELSQNYPNPFNPVTEIRYALPEDSHVRLTVYNLLGQEVTRLINATQPAGYHRVTFDSLALPSGIYFYRIAAGPFTEVRKMVVLK